jgi:hypothetical protein
VDLNGIAPKKNTKNVQIVNLRIYTLLIPRKKSKDLWGNRGLGEEVVVVDQAPQGCVNVSNADMKPLKLPECHAETINALNAVLYSVELIKSFLMEETIWY